MVQLYIFVVSTLLFKKPSLPCYNGDREVFHVDFITIWYSVFFVLCLDLMGSGWCR